MGNGQVKLSGVVITFNEEINIARCLDSLKNVVDEIIVVDSYSTDKTAEICRSYGVNFIQNEFKGHIEQKNFAIQKASYDHVLSLDADEVLSLPLQESILKFKDTDQLNGAFQVSRLTSYCGSWIRHCGWYPDRKIRLWDRRQGAWGGVNPHDKVILDASVQLSLLKGDLLHYSYPTIESHVRQLDKFSSIAAVEKFKRGKKVNVLVHIILYPFFIFLKTYFLKGGILDGYYGFIISINNAYYRFLKYIKLKRLYEQNESE